MRKYAKRLRAGVRGTRLPSLSDGAVMIILVFCLSAAIVEIAPAAIGKPNWRVYVTGDRLAGYTDEALPLRFNWWDRSFQTTLAALINERLRLRNLLIRINNQLDFWLLHTSRMYEGNIIIGNNGVLLEKAYIAQALGYAPMMPDVEMWREAENVKRLHDLLALRGIALIAIGTPGKVSFRRDAVPSSFPQYRPGAPRNYDRLVTIFAEAGVPFADGRAEMRRSDLSSRGPFYPKGGTHWTLLGAYAALERPISRLFAEVNPSSPGRILLDGLSATATPADSDADLMMLSNLLFPTQYGSLIPQLRLEGTPLPKAIALVGSSYGHQIDKILTSAGAAAYVMFFEYMRSFSPCLECETEKLPADWPKKILDNSSAVIIEINETAFFESANQGNDYIATLLNGLSPLLETSQPDRGLWECSNELCSGPR